MRGLGIRRVNGLMLLGNSERLNRNTPPYCGVDAVVPVGVGVAPGRAVGVAEGVGSVVAVAVGVGEGDVLAQAASNIASITSNATIAYHRFLIGRSPSIRNLSTHNGLIVRIKTESRKMSRKSGSEPPCIC